jgi:hypothetical protein
MSSRTGIVGSPDSPRRQSSAPKRQPAVALIVVAVLAGATLICTALIVPILWTAITESALRPSLTYDRCGTVQDDGRRLACFDGVFRKVSPHSTRVVAE